MTTPRVTVPVEPTPEMIAAACGEGDQHPLLKYLTPEERGGKAIFPLAIYRAMLSAAPVPEGGAVNADTILEVAAKAVEDHQKIGREWIMGSLWDDLTREASARIRALKADVRAQPPALTTAFMTRAKHLLDLAEKAEDDALEGVEGCVWPVEALRVAYTDLSALATREEAPAEAGVQETLRVLLDNLVIAQSLSKELRQRATDEARSYLSALRAQPPAREDAQPVGWKHTDKCWGKTSYSDEMAHCYCQKEQEKEASPQPVGWLRPDTLKGLMDADESVVGIQSLVAAHETKHNTVAVYTHPAPDALRVAVEALRWIDANAARSDCFEVSFRARQALAALQAEQGAK